MLYNKITKTVRNCVLKIELKTVRNKGVNIMTIAKQIDIRDNIKKYFDMAFHGETIIVPRKENKNVVIVSQTEYEELQNAKRIAEYYAMLDKSFEELKRGDVIVKSLEELRGMENE